MKKLIMLKIILGLITINLHGQTPLITNVKQIKASVRNEIVKNSSDFITLKSSVASLQSGLEDETTARTTADNNIISSLSNYVLKAGDTMTGALNVPTLENGTTLYFKISDKLSRLAGKGNKKTL